MAGNSAQGTLLQKRSGSSPTYTWTTIAQVTNIETDSSSDDLESTDLNSKAKEYEADIPDNGSVKTTLNFKPSDAAHRAMQTEQKARTKNVYRVFYPTYPLVTSGSQDGYASEFTAYPKSMKTKAATASILTADVEFRVSGEMSDLAAATVTVS